MTKSRSGYLFGVAGYLLWGAFPLYFPLLEPGSPVEILAHRILWSFVTMTIVVLAARRWRQFRRVLADRRTLGFLTLAAVVISVNWGMFIFGVTSGRVVETSLGYFINPLVTMLLGVIVLRERMGRGQWVALGIGALACVVLTIDYGRPPWVALTLALSFGTYGLAKKKADVEAIESLTVETMLLTPFALGFLIWLTLTGQSHFLSEGAGHTVLMLTAGVVTAIPLLCFGAAATRIPLNVLGLLQYLTPCLHFVIGVVVVGEQMSNGRWIGFGLVWLALITFTVSALRNRPRIRVEQR